ncbi:MAG: DUF3048 domain-containing protein [Eubacteriaceae bacterium]|nr:DUF3048 domain-containing protein [Eubacteriaceae bacterium]
MIKKALAILLTLTLVFTAFGCGKKEEAQEVRPKPVIYYNPLTGKGGYKKEDLNKRPIAVVVENSPEARPQWGISTPDIIVEGEVEGGITRMLWLYGNANRLPEKVGPTRSARPSFVKFSKFFDAVYIHWGGSHSKDGYTGGYETIAIEGVDDLDGMAGGALFTRDTTRNVSSEHTGVVLGDKLNEVLKSSEIRTKVDKDSVTKLPFRKKAKKISDNKADKVRVTFSSSTDTRKFKYNSEDKKYHTGDWEKDVKFDNLLILKSDTTYITTTYKDGYVTYLNYALDGGTAYYASKGYIRKIKWVNEDGKIKLTTQKGNAIKLNPGKTYIGLVSSNHSGSVKYSEVKTETTTETETKTE